MLERRDVAADDDGMLIALTVRYEVTALGEEQSGSFLVAVDDAVFPDEAVVRVATALDGIDAGWERHFSWPKALR